MTLKAPPRTDLSAAFEAYTGLRATGAASTGQSVLGLFYSLGVYYRRFAAVRELCSALFVVTGYLIYLIVQRAGEYPAPDLVLYILAVNSRPLKVIALAAETEHPASTPASKTPASGNPPKPRPPHTRHSWTDLLLLPVLPKSDAAVGFDQSVDEIIFRISIFAMIKQLVTLRSQVVETLLRGAAVCSGSYGLRQLEHLVAGSPPPGRLSPELYPHYLKLVYLVLLAELCIY